MINKGIEGAEGELSTATRQHDSEVGTPTPQPVSKQTGGLQFSPHPTNKNPFNLSRYSTWTQVCMGALVQLQLQIVHNKCILLQPTDELLQLKSGLLLQHWEALKVMLIRFPWLWIWVVRSVT